MQLNTSSGRKHQLHMWWSMMWTGTIWIRYHFLLFLSLQIKKKLLFFCSRKMQSSRSWLNKIYSWIYWSTVDLFMQSWWVPCGQLLTLRELLQKNEAIQFSTWLCRKGHPQPHSCQTFCFSEVSPNAFETQWKQLYEDSSISFPQNTWFSSSFVYF